MLYVKIPTAILDLHNQKALGTCPVCRFHVPSHPLPTLVSLPALLTSSDMIPRVVANLKFQCKPGKDSRPFC